MESGNERKTESGVESGSEVESFTYRVLIITRDL